MQTALSANPVTPSAIVLPEDEPSQPEEAAEPVGNPAIVFPQHSVPSAHDLAPASPEALQIACEARGAQIISDLGAALAVADQKLQSGLDRDTRNRLLRYRKRIAADLDSASKILEMPIAASSAPAFHSLAKYPKAGDIRSAIRSELASARSELALVERDVQDLREMFGGDLAKQSIVRREGDPVRGMVEAQREACRRFLVHCKDQAQAAERQVLDAWGPSYGKLRYQPTIRSAWHVFLGNLTEKLAERDELAEEIRTLTRDLDLASELIREGHANAIALTAGGREKVTSEVFASMVDDVDREIAPLQKAFLALKNKLEGPTWSDSDLVDTGPWLELVRQRDEAEELYQKTRTETIACRKTDAQQLVDRALAGDESAYAAIENRCKLAPGINAALKAGRSDIVLQNAFSASTK